MDITVWNVLSVWFLIGAVVVLFGVVYYSQSRESEYLTDGDRWVLVSAGMLVWPIAIYIIRVWYETSRSKWSGVFESQEATPKRTERRIADRRQISTRRLSDDKRLHTQRTRRMEGEWAPDVKPMTREAYDS